MFAKNSPKLKLPTSPLSSKTISTNSIKNIRAKPILSFVCQVEWRRLIDLKISIVLTTRWDRITIGLKMSLLQKEESLNGFNIYFLKSCLFLWGISGSIFTKIDLSFLFSICKYQTSLSPSTTTAKVGLLFKCLVLFFLIANINIVITQIGCAT